MLILQWNLYLNQMYALGKCKVFSYLHNILFHVNLTGMKAISNSFRNPKKQVYYIQILIGRKIIKNSIWNVIGLGKWQPWIMP